MKEPSIEAKQQVLKEFLYHIRKDKRVDVEENKLFKLSFKYMKLSKEQVLACDSEVKENIGDACEEGTFEAKRFFENLKEYHFSLVKDYISWFGEFADLLDATDDFNDIFEIVNKKMADDDSFISSVSQKVEDSEVTSNVSDQENSEVTEQVDQSFDDDIQKPDITDTGDAYQEGLVKLKENNMSSAIELFQVGMDQGDMPSIIQMACLHEDCGSPIYNPPKAFEIYSKLSSQGLGEATRALAVMTMEGRGIGINSPKAVSIFEKAIKQGDFDSKEMLEDLLMTLTPEEIEKSKRF